ncbi:MAG: ribbon-helix-helix domain-containing protein [Candidatus Aerophobetes bacterium]|nr:ribbon-helix-helix domain-containing protein [Candidatus Aerophobetes bacterium]
MATKKRTHVVVPEKLVQEIDRLSGKRKRSQFITQAVRKEIQRLNFLKAVKETAGGWKDEDHPEFKKGVDSYAKSFIKQNDRTGHHKNYTKG